MNADQWTLLFQVGLPLILLALGLTFGRVAEQRHYRSIHRREKERITVPVTTEKRLCPRDRTILQTRLARGSVVVSVDHFKRFLAWMRGLFGGEIHAYGSLLDRARREARLRMLESCKDADFFLNFRMETSTISSSAGNAMGTVEVLAYATAVYFEQVDPSSIALIESDEIPSSSSS